MHHLIELARKLPSPWLLPATALILGACLAVWTLVVLRVGRGKPVVPYQPRVAVPWSGIDVLVVFLVYVAAPMTVMRWTVWYFDLGAAGTPVTDQAATPHTEHPAARVLMESGNPWALALCVVTVVVVAAIIEEFLFRLVLQGWLEAVERRLSRRMPQLRRTVPGASTLLISSILFALLHYREPAPPMDLRRIVLGMGVQAVMSLVTLAIAVVLLRFRTGATLEDLGIVPRMAGKDVKLGLATFFAVFPFVYLVNFVAHTLLPADVVADPIPILFLALALGTLYCRTHRIVPAIVLHMAFNASGVAIALTVAGK